MTLFILSAMQLQKFKLPSFAKINWFLRVLGKREDGYHEICTAFQTVSLCDEITFERDERLLLSSSDENIPVDGSNLIIKSANVLRESFGIEEGARIHLEKRIPFPAGLGGGSSNAAIALLGLSKLWKLEIGYEKLVELGSKIGADVPFFFVGGTALGTGVGATISDCRNVDEKLMLITTPNVDISTADAYQELDAQRLTKTASKSILQNCYEEAMESGSKQTILVNDFESRIFEIEPKIRHLKLKLFDLGAKKVLMSGSGASVFSVFDNEEKRQSAFTELSETEGLSTFAVETISRQEYRKRLESCIDLLQTSL